MSNKIGIFAGTFDPIHEGHVSFVASAIDDYNLDSVLVIPEASPRGKQGVSEITHRVAMVRLATNGMAVRIITPTSPHVSLATVRTYTRATDELFLLLGTDVALTMKTWPELGEMNESMRYIVGVRSRSDRDRIDILMAHLGILPPSYGFVTTHNALQNSSLVRSTKTSNIPAVNEYIQTHRLYTV